MNIDYNLENRLSCFKEELIQDIICIPCQKPDIERVLDVVVDVNVLDYKIIKTDLGVSNEGQRLTGYKLVVKLGVKEKIYYVADRLTQSVHAAHYDHVKSIFIVVPKEIDGVDTCNLVKKQKVSVNCIIEAVNFKQLDRRCIQKCVLLLVSVNKIGKEAE